MLSSTEKRPNLLNYLITFFLSLLLVGLGHFYVRKGGRGLIWLSIFYGGFFITALSGVIHKPAGLESLWYFYLCVYAGQVIDAMFLVHGSSQRSRMLFSRSWVFFPVMLILWLSLFMAIQFKVPLLGYGTIKIPMAMPGFNIKEGEWIVVDTRDKGIDRYKKGDLVVFKTPDRHMRSLGRVYAKSKDLVNMGDNQVANAFTRNYTVPPNNLYVLQDFPYLGNDSRRFGGIPVADISGRVSVIVGFNFPVLHCRYPDKGMSGQSNKQGPGQFR